MASLRVPVSEYMSAPVHHLEPEAPLPLALHHLTSLGISSLAVLDRGRLAGVITRADLLRCGLESAQPNEPGPLLTIPRCRVGQVMSAPPVTVDLDEAIDSAAALMVRKRVHRVFVVRGQRVLGVVSTRDLMVAARDQLLEVPLHKCMSAPVHSISIDESIAEATGRFTSAGISGLVVVEDRMPVGLFTQVEALECRDLDGATPIGEVMHPGLLCLPQRTKLHRAAQQATTMRARRIIAVENREMVGVVTGLDFAAAVGRKAQARLVWVPGTRGNATLEA